MAGVRPLAARATAWLIAPLTLLVACSRPLDGPEPVDWDRVACSHCGMLVSTPGFAAQLHTAEGRALHFDDPGCLLLYAHEDAVALWFHDRDGEVWHAREDVVFVPAENTPMNYGLAARAQDTAVGLSLAEATAYVRALDAQRRGTP